MIGSTQSGSPIVVFETGEKNRGKTGEDLQRAARGVRNGVRNCRLQRSRVIGRTADELPDVDLSVEAHGLVHHLPERFVAHIRRNFCPDPARVVVVDEDEEIADHPEEHEPGDENRKELPCHAPRCRFRRQVQKSRIPDRKHDIAVPVGNMHIPRGGHNIVELFVRFEQLLLQLSPVVGSQQDRGDRFDFFLFRGTLFICALDDAFRHLLLGARKNIADSFDFLLRFRFPLHDLNDLRRRLFNRRNIFRSVGIDPFHQVRDHEQSAEQRTAGDETCQNSYRETPFIGFCISQQTPVIHEIAFSIVVRHQGSLL